MYNAKRFLFLLGCILLVAWLAHRLKQAASLPTPGTDPQPAPSLWDKLSACGAVRGSVEKPGWLAEDLEGAFAALYHQRSDLGDTATPEGVMARVLVICEEGEVGEHCSSPFPCPFWDRCHAPLPEQHVSTLYRYSQAAADLEARGIELIRNIPDDFDLTPVQRRQVMAARTDAVVVENRDGRARILDGFPRPWGYLDFETIGLPMPRWEGCRPYDQVPVQFVYYQRDGQEAAGRDEWLASDDRDPRPELARHLVEACRGAAVIFTWNEDF